MASIIWRKDIMVRRRGVITHLFTEGCDDHREGQKGDRRSHQISRRHWMYKCEWRNSPGWDNGGYGIGPTRRTPSGVEQVIGREKELNTNFFEMTR